MRAGLAAAGLAEAPPAPIALGIEPMARPPVLCAGCPHTGDYLALRGIDARVAGDIGCYTLAAVEPLRSIDTTVCMGASIGNAVGMAAAGEKKPVVATIGNSTFLHSGIPPLIDAVYNKANVTVVILDNSITAMTGGQDHPGTGRTLRGEAGVEGRLRGDLPRHRGRLGPQGRSLRHRPYVPTLPGAYLSAANRRLLPFGVAISGHSAGRGTRACAPATPAPSRSAARVSALAPEAVQDAPRARPQRVGDVQQLALHQQPPAGVRVHALAREHHQRPLDPSAACTRVPRLLECASGSPGARSSTYNGCVRG